MKLKLKNKTKGVLLWLKEHITFGMILSLLLLIASVTILVNIKEDAFDFLTSTRNGETFFDKDLILELWIAVSIFIVASFVLLYQKAKKEKRIAKPFLLAAIFLISFLFDVIMLSGFVATLTFLEKFPLPLKVFDVYLVNFLLFIIGSVITFDKVIKSNPDKDNVLRLLLRENILKALFIPVVVIYVVLAIFSGVEILFISFLVGIIVAFYASVVVTVQFLNLIYRDLFVGV